MKVELPKINAERIKGLEIFYSSFLDADLSSNAELLLGSYSFLHTTILSRGFMILESTDIVGY